jgi:SAM-dependent methyltransferase
LPLAEPTVSSFSPKAVLNAVHNEVVFTRRVAVLSRHLADIIPGPGRVLDLGCGDGSIAAALMKLRPDLRVEGVDVFIRPKTHIPVTRFDGETLPFDEESFDFVTIVDVLHHTEDAAQLLAEAARVSRRSVIVKDHLLRGFAAAPTLRFMDWVGNRGHDVVLPYNYLTPGQWSDAFERAGLEIIERRDRLNLYPQPFSALFDRDLHFIAQLRPGHARS